MRKLLASLGIAAILAVGLFVSKGAIAPQPAQACSTYMHSSSPVTFTNYFDYGTYSYQNLNSAVQLWIDSCAGNYYTRVVMWTGGTGWIDGRIQFEWYNGNPNNGGSGFEDCPMYWINCAATSTRFAWGPNIHGTNYYTGGSTSYAYNDYWSPATVHVPAICWSFTYGRNC